MLRLIGKTGVAAFGATLPLAVVPAKDSFPPRNEPARAGGELVSGSARFRRG
jgi:hypothetical protein